MSCYVILWGLFRALNKFWVILEENKLNFWTPGICHLYNIRYDRFLCPEDRNQYSHGIDTLLSNDFSQHTLITLLSRPEWRAKSFSNYSNCWHATRPANIQLFERLLVKLCLLTGSGAFPTIFATMTSQDRYARSKLWKNDREWHVQNRDIRHPDSMFNTAASIIFKYMGPNAVSGMINPCLFAMITREMGVFKPGRDVTWLYAPNW